MNPVNPIPGYEPTQRFSAAEHNALPPGTQINDYEVVRVLGEGGFSIVYLAEDRTLERRVAIKEYLPVSLAMRGQGSEVTLRNGSHADTFAQGLVSFINEARLLARFDHPSLVRVHHFWRANSTAYMVMPYLEGSTLLAARRAMAGPPDESWLRELLWALLGALEVLHEASCYHRDIAPDNILILPDGRPLLLDFGAARHVIGEKTQQLTAILKPAYAPIEQYAEAKHLQQGPWTDLYALGAVARFCITGAAPTPSTVRAMHDDMESVANEVRNLSRDYPGLRYSAPFLAAVDWALAVRPADRPQNVQQFKQALSKPYVLPTVRVSPPAAPAPVESPAPVAEAPDTPLAAPAQQEFDGSAELSEEERAEAAVKRLLESVDAPAKADAGPPRDEPWTASRHDEPWTAPRHNEPWTASRPEAPWTASRPAELKGAGKPQRPLSQAVLFGIAAVALGALGAAALLWNVERRHASEAIAAAALDTRGQDVPAAGAAPGAVPATPPSPAVAPPAAPPVQPAAAPVQPAAAPAQAAANTTVAPASESTPRPVAAPPAPPPAPTRAEAPPQGATTAATRNARAPSPPETSRVTDATGTRASTRARARAPAPAEPDNPRAVCAPRQQFALYYCMQTQCQNTRYYAHPQCVDLRRRDEVE